MLFPVYNCSSVWIVQAEDEEEGSEMERLEKSSIAFEHRFLRWPLINL